MRRLQCVIRRARCKLDDDDSPEFNQHVVPTTLAPRATSRGRKDPLLWAGFGAAARLASIRQLATGLGACIDLQTLASYKFDAHHERRRQGHVKIVRRN